LRRARVGDVVQGVSANETPRSAKPADPSAGPEHALLHPLWWAALLLLVANDHLLKGADLLPPWLTGKLSDVSGLVVAPVLLAALLRARGRLAQAGCLAATASVFAVINLLPSAARLWEQLTSALGIGWRVWCDPSDLLALPVLALAWWLLRRAQRTVTKSAWHRGARVLAVAIGAAACMGTSPAVPPRPMYAPTTVLAHAWYSGPVHIIDVASGQSRGSFDPAGLSRASRLRDGIVYGVASHAVHAQHYASGRKQLAYHHQGAALLDVLLVDDANLYLQTQGQESLSERVVAVDRRTGKRAWTRPIDARRSWLDPSQHPVLTAGMLLVTLDKGLEALDPTNGASNWIYQTASSPRWPSATATEVFVGTDGGLLHALDATTGARIWQYPTGDPKAFKPTQAGSPRLGALDGAVFFIAHGHVLALDARTRALRWQGPKARALGFGAHSIVASLDEGVFAALDVRDGRQLWRVELDGWLFAPPLVAEQDGVVLLRPHDEVLYALDLETGALRWKVDLDDGSRVEQVSDGALLLRGVRPL